VADLIVSRLAGVIADDLQYAIDGENAESANVTSNSPKSVSSRVSSP
jgi:hypothetical protein